MGKLSDRIRGGRRAGRRQIGFTGAKTAPLPSGGLLIAAAGTDRSGADLLLLPDAGNDIGGALKAPLAAADGAPVGIVLAQASHAGAKTAADAGAAFIVLHPEGATADALLEPKIDIVIQLPAATPSETELRALGSLLPALLITDGLTADPLPFASLLTLRAIGLLTQTPLAVRVAPDVSDRTLESMRDAGAVVVILNTPTEEHIAALRSRIAALPTRAQRTNERATALVPLIQSAEDFEEDFEDD